MKLRKLLLKTMPVIVLSTGLATSITSCGNTNGVPRITSHEVRLAFMNTLSRTSSGRLFYVTSQYGRVEVHHFNGSEVGYVNVDDYVNYLMQFEEIYGPDTANYSSKTSNYKTIITNSNNNSTATIDYEQQTITFSDYDMFGCEEKAYKNNPLAVGAGGGESYYVKDPKTGDVFFDSVYISGGQYTIDLKKYSIKAYYDDGKGYIPYDLYRNILNRNPLNYMFYNGVNFYQVSTANNINTIDLYKPIREEATILTKEYMEHCYNILALTLDHKFGLYERLGRSEENKGKTIKYFPNGAYDKLAPWHDQLTSLDPDVSNDAMSLFFAAEADDGGHAGYSGLDILSTRPHQTTRGPEKANTFAVMDMIQNARDEIFKDKYDGTLTAVVDPVTYWLLTDPSVITDDYTPEDYVYVNNDDPTKPIMYITFDAFNAVDRYTWDEQKAGHVLYDHVNADIYHYDTIRMTMYANQLIRAAEKAGTPIKNVVVDLSNNGGGTVYTEHFLASWLCGGQVKESIWNPHTKSFAQYTIKANVDNTNEVIDENDYLPADTKLFVITSETSFSCGNMLPCNIADNRPNNTYFIGCPSGGGACFVDGNMHVGLGNVFRSSSNYHMLRNSSTKDKKVSVESGHLSSKSEFWYPIESTLDEALNYVDRFEINKRIRAL